MLQKFAQVEEILEVRSSKERLSYEYGSEPGAGLSKFAALDEGIREDDGYLYVRCRAISSRVNKNNDGWPSEELDAAYETFLGRPIFVDHNNDDPKRTRGVIVDSKVFVKDAEKESTFDPYYATAPDNHKPPTHIELLLEVDAETYPKLAEKVRKGEIDAVSMGANIERSVCSVCANEATTPAEYCSHIKQKGLTFEITSVTGERIKKKAYEDCYGVNFFEISFVFDPADETALISEKTGKTAEIIRGWEPEGEYPRMTPDDFEDIAVDGRDELIEVLTVNGLAPDASTAGRWYDLWATSGMTPELQAQLEEFGIRFGKTADIADFFVAPPTTDQGEVGRERNFTPQSEMVTAPQEVNTLRKEELCPVCRASDMQNDPDGILRCPICGHVQEPEPLDNPNLDVARDTDLRQENAPVNQDNQPQIPADDASGGSNLNSVTFEPVQRVSPVGASKASTSDAGISEMFKTQLKTHSKEEADKVLPAKFARVETTLGVDRPIHPGVYRALKDAGLNVKVTYSAIERPDNTTDIPNGKRPIIDFFLAEESASRLGIALNEVPIVVEASTVEDANKALELIRTTEVRKRAATTVPTDTKVAVTPEEKPSETPKDEQIVSDQLEPVEAAVKGAGGVTVKDRTSDKSYLLEFNDGGLTVSEVESESAEEDKSDPEKVVDELGEEGESEKKEADRRHIVRTVINPDGSEASEEIVEESDTPPQSAEQPQPVTPAPVAEEQTEEEEVVYANAKQDAETRLLTAFKLADLAVELGIVEARDKMAFIAELEDESEDALSAREKTLAAVKNAGLSKKEAKKVTGITRVPRLAHTTTSLNGRASGDDLDVDVAAIFLG